jgi:diguanylate cyclase (GGDEF)-like protein
LGQDASVPAKKSVKGCDLTNPRYPAEVRHLLDRHAATIKALEATVADLRAQNAELMRLADQDALMPMANRRAFLQAVSRQISNAKRHGGQSSLLYVDLDNMKQINDRFGHAAGDAALIHLADTLIANVRNEDVVGRLGGDEFGVLLIGSGQQAADEKAVALGQALRKVPLVWNGMPIVLSAAIGAHEIAEGSTVEASLEAADLAMYRVKHTNRLTQELSGSVQ